jgi:hypothetical protein
MLTHDSRPAYDIFMFRRFRLNLITFLRLPLNVSEAALRNATGRSSQNLFASYLLRAERAFRDNSAAPTEDPQTGA